MKRLPRIGLVVSCILLALGSGFALSGSAPASKVDVRVDGFVFEPGAAVALELVSSEGATCFVGDLLVGEVQLADSLGNLISVRPFDTIADASDWLGVVMLRAGDGADLPPGAYEIRVVTSGGTFTAGLRVVPAAQFASLDRFVAGIPACNTALRLYRLLTELDDGTHATLRVGDRVMVLLAGNPTTGYSWSSPLLYENAPLRELEEVEYRSDSNLLGAGGYFIFRYWAMGTGTLELGYNYRRSWETVEPILSMTFSLDVR